MLNNNNKPSTYFSMAAFWDVAPCHRPDDGAVSTSETSFYFYEIIWRYIPESSAGYLSRCSVWLRAGRPGDRDSIPGRGERIFPPASVGKRIFPVTSVSGLALGPTQPPVQWVPGVLSPGLKRSRGETLTTHPHLVPSSKMSRSYTFSSPKQLRGV
jgi:hypothetical protein